jgi:hypothetical protein
MPPFAPADRVILLGAGATVGADFGKHFKTTVRPPLNRDFFTQLQRITGKHETVVKSVIKDVVGLFGPNFDLTLEDYFSQLEFLLEATDLVPTKQAAITRSQLRRNRDRLMTALAAVLEASTDAAIRKYSGCMRHRRIVEVLRPRDTILSFNYDCVIDDALRRKGDAKWAARYGYAFAQPSRIVGDAHWSPTDPAKSALETIYLLKLHGSLNWQLPPTPDGAIKIKQRLHAQYGTPRFTIVPPAWNKSQKEEPIFQDLWKKAERAIRTARSLAVVGFSFTPTDLHVEALFRLALAGSGLQTLVIANPSGSDRARIREVFSQPLARNAVVRQYSSLDEFTRSLPDCLE